jgi:hypothetical protein
MKASEYNENSFYMEAEGTSMVSRLANVDKSLRKDAYRHTPSLISNEQLAATITKAASKQSYYTIRLLVDTNRRADAYRAYAYFRWVDDTLDEGLSEQTERLTFIERQKRLVESACNGERTQNLAPEEQMLLDLMRGEAVDSPVHSYVQNMIGVMAFDADRKGRLISQQELDDYTLHLATAVTEALHYYIGHDQFAPHDETRYLAVSAAHIIHMLRDTCEDIAIGYYNIPREFLEAHKIYPQCIHSAAFRDWVQYRVQLARNYFRTGKAHLAQVENIRCRIAGYAYIVRFEWVLETIERENYLVRQDYHERKSLRAGLSMGWSVLWHLLGSIVPNIANIQHD